METKFKPKPSALPDLPNPDAVARFASGAGTRSATPTSLLSAEAPEALPFVHTENYPSSSSLDEELDWKKFDKDEKTSGGYNVRFNRYEYAMITAIAKADKRSIHQTIKLLLIHAAEKAAEKLK